VKFFQILASLYLHKFTNFGRFILMLNKMALLFRRSTCRFYHFKFRVSASQVALNSAL